MRRQISASRRWARLLLTVTFVWAAGIGAYGAPECPDHDAIPGHELAGGDHGVGHAVDHTSGHAADSQGGQHAGSDGVSHTGSGHTGDGPCTCIEHCQVPTAGPPSASEPDVSPAEPRIVVGLEHPSFEDEILGPRHDLFHLHLPNAPPLPS